MGEKRGPAINFFNYKSQKTLTWYKLIIITQKIHFVIIMTPVKNNLNQIIEPNNKRYLQTICEKRS